MKTTGFIMILSLLVLAAPGVHAAQLEAPRRPIAMDAPGLHAGDRAPDFRAVTHEGKPVQLSEVYARGPVVLIFYRGNWCPYCNLHLQQFQQSLDEIRARGANVLAVSVDRPEYARKTVAQGSLGFDVIGNPGAEILEAYGLIYKVPDELVDTYRNEYHIDLEAHSGRTDHVLAVPATYVMNTSGEIIFAYADPDYKVRTSPQQVLEVLDSYRDSQ